LSRNLGTLASWNPLDLSRPVMGLLYLYLTDQYVRRFERWIQVILTTMTLIGCHNNRTTPKHLPTSSKLLETCDTVKFPKHYTISQHNLAATQQCYLAHTVNIRVPFGTVKSQPIGIALTTPNGTTQHQATFHQFKFITTLVSRTIPDY